MDPAFRHRRSPSSDRFLGISSSSSTSAASDGGDELNEDDILWTNDPTEPNNSNDNHDINNNNHNHAFTSSSSNHSRSSSFTHQQNSGILAALPEHDSRPILNRKNSISSSASSSASSSKMIPTIPKPPQMERSQSMPNNRKYQHSAPMNVPLLSIAMAKQRNSRFFELDEEEADDEMLPPHEIVARGSGVSPKTTFSVLEGVGRTLKGRDLRQCRMQSIEQNYLVLVALD
ncbi:Senescence regulator [Melia azedarach]|uniref:Senescence regulator n=1 Tax=Melia azedarach TaxID=155640 RepID=A0ACC1X3N2_MELAZ|nr:Senescence regulator [Melia azedarach]